MKSAAVGPACTFLRQSDPRSPSRTSHGPGRAYGVAHRGCVATAVLADRVVADVHLVAGHVHVLAETADRKQDLVTARPSWASQHDRRHTPRMAKWPPESSTRPGITT